MTKFWIASIEGALMTALLVLWIGVPFMSWNFWGPFTAWAIVSSVFDGIKTQF